MGFRLRKSYKILPGVRLNLSKTGISFTLLEGSPLTFNVGRHGGKTTSRMTFDLPGTGLYYEKRGILEGDSKDTSSEKAKKPSPETKIEEAPPDLVTSAKLDLSFIDRVILPGAETAFVDGLRLLNEGNETAALEKLRGAVSTADGAILAALLAYYEGRYDEALQYALTAKEKSGELGQLFAKYGLDIELVLPVTDEFTAHVPPDMAGVMQLLAAIYREMGRDRDVLATLHWLYQRHPNDLIVRASLVELLLDHAHEDKEILQKILEMTDGIENETTIHAALLLYRGMALRRLGLPEVARDVLTNALRRTKDRPEDLLLALRYERALAYEEMGKKAKAEDELKKIFATHSTYEDVAQRLGVATAPA